MSSQELQSLQQQVQALSEENRALRAELAGIEERADKRAAVRAQVLRGGWRLFIPLIDRQRVVRSFAKLASTTSGFAGPMGSWPSKDQIIAETREFLESCVRFAIRRRTLFLIFSLVAATVPAIQLWLVIQQNEIIENQNEFFEIQVYDIVSRSMTEGDRNARQMTGALLARSKLEFLEGIIEEAFALQPARYTKEDVYAIKRRFEDAALRGHLIRAVVRGVEIRGREGEFTAEEIHRQARNMFRQILSDTEWRVPEVLQRGRQVEQNDDELYEQVDYYFSQVSSLLRTYARLARTASDQRSFFDDTRPLFRRLAGLRIESGNRFAEVYRAVMEEFLFDLAVAPAFGAPAVVDLKKLSPEEALQQGMQRLRAGLGDDALNWAQFKQQMGVQ